MTESSNEIEFDCFGFCADPIELQISAMTLMGLANSLRCNSEFIANNYQQFLSQEGLDYEVDPVEYWGTDCREQIITKVTSLAIGSRRLLQTKKEEFDIHHTVDVGYIVTRCGKHDRCIDGSSLDLHSACSRLVHSAQLKIVQKTNCNEAELIVTSDSGGVYTICLSSFSLACWLLTK